MNSGRRYSTGGSTASISVHFNRSKTRRNTADNLTTGRNNRFSIKSRQFSMTFNELNIRKIDKTFHVTIKKLFLGYFHSNGKIFQIRKSSTIKEDEVFESENRLEPIKEANSKSLL